MSDLKSADEIIEEYSKPYSSIDNGNLYFACCTYQTEYKKLQTELAQLKELLATRNTDLRDAIDENSKLKEKCGEAISFIESLSSRSLYFVNDDSQAAIAESADKFLEKWKGKG